MGLKSFFANPSNRRTWVKLVLSGSASLFFASCISDGPNQTGGQYLTQHGILQPNPLYHVKVDAFPVSDFGSSSEEASRLGDTIQLLGTANQFSARMRLAFDLSDTTFFDSLQDTAASARDFRLSLGAQSFPYGYEALRKIIGDSIHGQDSLRFIVESWAFPDSGADSAHPDVARLTDAQRADSMSVYNHRFLSVLDSTSLLPKVKAVDTITLRIKNIYTDSSLRLQNRPLPNLRAYVKSTGRGLKWFLQMQISPIVTAKDTGYAMLRLGGSTISPFCPSLLLGANVIDASSATTKQRVLPALVGTGAIGMNYILRYGGAPWNMVPALRRGMHFKLDRAKLLDSVDAALRRQGITPPAHPSAGEFDLTYFIPFGTISLPLADSLRLEGGFPQRIDLASDVDSLIPTADLQVDPHSAAAGKFTTVSIPLLDDGADKSKAQHLISVHDRLNSEKIIDTLSLRYCKVAADTTLRRVLFSYGRDSANNDTLYMRIGEYREVALILPGSSTFSPTVFQLTANDGGLQCTFFIASNSGNSNLAPEYSDFVDPTTGEKITDLAKLVPNFLHPGASALQMRATRGLQRLFNRRESGNSIQPDFEIKVSPYAAVDSLAQVSGASSPQYVPYRLLSIIPPKAAKDRLTVSLDLYLYPLKAR